MATRASAGIGQSKEFGIPFGLLTLVAGQIPGPCFSRHITGSQDSNRHSNKGYGHNKQMLNPLHQNLYAKTLSSIRPPKESDM